MSHARSIRIILNTSSATGANIKETMTNLPVILKLDKSNFDFTVLKKGIAGDITITDNNGSFYPYKVKSFDKTSKTAELLIVVEKVLGNNSTQSLTLSYGKAIDAITDQDTKAEVEEKKAKEIDGQNKSSTLFKDSYAVFGVWTSNENGFTINK